ncbi:ketopantoate reductase family protein [Colwellia echini]|uniref:2-dehydropantoate 2-reductase n=1 Tax=Colwellia echini TaxID=1982103 RepID=A0ABY3MXK3_9GAMM|nr:2-dehydropantoate 2-reductase [Colwellia echini]TYK65938.1 2-dehydropantoate 2-reductase [Colwellia echini]
MANALSVQTKASAQFKEQSDNQLRNIVVVGQGAIGLLWYHHLSKTQDTQKKRVSLLASNQHLFNKNVDASLDENKKKSSTELNEASYQFTPYRQKNKQTYPLIYSQLSDIESADVILLCVKSYQIAKAIKNIAKITSPHCIIILAHNGMGTFEEIAKLLPKSQRILAMLTTHGSLRQSAFSITHTGLGQSDIGLLSGNTKYTKPANSTDANRLGELTLTEQQHLTKLFNDALPKVTFHKDITDKQWLKLAINCVINPITAINDIDNGEINNDNFAEQIHCLLTEISDVSYAVGINLQLDDLQKAVQNVAKATATNCSSMRCDVLAGNTTEIDYINGYIHRLGEKYGIATPENTRMWQEVKSLG